MIGSALRFLRDTRAGPLVTFALVLPMLVALIFTGFEIARLILANQKVANAASIVADLVGQTEDILTEGDLAQLMGAARRVGEPFDLRGRGAGHRQLLHHRRQSAAEAELAADRQRAFWRHPAESPKRCPQT